MAVTKLRGAVAMVAIATLAAACGSSGSSNSGSGASGDKGDSTGVTATSVTLGSHYPLTGPVAPGYSEIGPAAKAYFDYVNESGGINGRKITFKFLDDAYNPANTVSVVRQLVLQDKVFAIMGGLGTPTHTKVVDFLNQSKVPDLFVASGCACWDEPQKHPYTFGWQPDYTVEGKILGQYVKNNFAGKKIAYFYQNDEFGLGGVKGLDQYVDKASVVTRQPYQAGNLDLTAQIGAIAQSKADVVVSFSVPIYTALLRLGMLKAGISPQLVVSNVGSDPVTLSGLLEAVAKKGGATVKGSQLIEGMISDAYLPPYLGADAASNSWIKLFKTVHDKYIPNLPFDGNVEYGMAEAYTFVQVLQKAGKNPTRQNVVAALEAGGFEGPGLVPFRYSKDSHAGFTGVRVTQIKGGVPVWLGDAQTTDNGSGDITKSDLTPPEAPSNGIPSS
jgi:branched-chain amino acid transport system substrate-binding protein